MKIDPSKEPSIVRQQGAVRVTLYLAGDEGEPWVQDFNTAAEEAQIDANAVQWAISVTLKDIDKVGETLSSAVELLDTANQAWADRNKDVQAIENKAEKWWKNYIDPPPLTNR